MTVRRHRDLYSSSCSVLSIDCFIEDISSSALITLELGGDSNNGVLRQTVSRASLVAINLHLLAPIAI
jgi:hypothetical protein